MADHATLDELVETWLTVPDVAERLGVEVGRVRTLVSEGSLAGVRRGEPPVLSIPAAFLVDIASPVATPAAPNVPEPGPRWGVLTHLPGTLTVLTDVGFGAEGAIRWLFTPDDSLGGAPIDALRAGQRAEIRRRAQALL